jgi:acyl carrier protein
MYLEDCLLLKLDHERLMKVVRPKMSGAWNLHTQTLDCPLDYFVMFSSMSTTFGLPGQANYAASNAFLDQLAYHRRALGLPALTIDWGYLADVGYVARNEKVSERLEGQGVLSYSPREALAILERMLQQEAVQVGVARVDWARWRGVSAAGGVSPRFAHLVQEAESNQDGQKADGAAIRKTLLAAPPEQRKELMLSFLRDKVARVLGASAAKVDVDKPLTEVGLDSLMAVELRNWIEGELRVNLPIVELMQGPSVSRLAELLVEQLVKGDAPPPKAVAPAAPVLPEANGHAETNGKQAEQLLGKVDELSDAEVDSLLGEMLAEKEQGS